VDRTRAVGIAVGGALGASSRWAVLSATDAGRFPWPVLALNVAGSFALGVLLAVEWDHPRVRWWLHDLGGIGFCGGLTTFSTFAVEVVELADEGDAALAAVYGASSVVLAVAAVAAGAAALHRVRAAGLPLEEAP
jgi:CrcB protein